MRSIGPIAMMVVVLGIVAIQILLWASAVISGVLDNIPYTITMGGYACLACPCLLLHPADLLCG